MAGIAELIERIRFKHTFARSFPMVYDDNTGDGLNPLSYSVLLDEVRYRMSRFGTYSIGGHSGQVLPRQDFLSLYSDPRWRPLRVLDACLQA